MPNDHFLLLKKVLVLLVSNRMIPFRSLYDNSFYKKCPGLKKMYNTLCQQYSLRRPRCYAAHVIRSLVQFQSRNMHSYYAYILGKYQQSFSKQTCPLVNKNKSSLSIGIFVLFFLVFSKTQYVGRSQTPTKLCQN